MQWYLAGEKKQTTDTCNGMETFKKHYAKWKTQKKKKDNILYNSIYLTF